MKGETNMPVDDMSTLERIHNAAKAEFMEKGYRSASLRSIVKAAGVTTGAFYGYYASKQELFAALVDGEYEYILGEYKKALNAFEELPAERKPEQMGNAGRDCMKRMLEYSYGHRDALFLILQRSEGTKYAGMVDEMVELEVDGTHKYYEVLRKLGNTVPYIDERLEHILVTGMMNAYFEMIVHDMPHDDARRYLEELNDFYTAGWLKLMGVEHLPVLAD